MVGINPNNKNAITSAFDETIDGNNAIVKVRVQRPGEKDVLVIVPLVKDGTGHWKVTWTKTNGGMK